MMTPHPPQAVPLFSLRLGHLRGLAVHWTVIQYPKVTPLPTGEGISHLLFCYFNSIYSYVRFFLFIGITFSEPHHYGVVFVIY